MICENCPFGKLVQTDSFIWMVECSVNDCLMAREDECFFPEKMKCTNCIYFNNESESCDMPYENSCLRAKCHYFRTHPIEFAEEYLDIKLYPWQKIILKYFLRGRK